MRTLTPYARAQRLQREADALMAKMEKLEDFTRTDTFRALDKIDQDLLLDQRFHMRQYHKALASRILRIKVVEA